MGAVVGVFDAVAVFAAPARAAGRIIRFVRQATHPITFLAGIIGLVILSFVGFCILGIAGQPAGRCLRGISGACSRRGVFGVIDHGSFPAVGAGVPSFTWVAVGFVTVVLLLSRVVAGGGGGVGRPGGGPGLVGGGGSG